jgi:hypothetical protein
MIYLFGLKYGIRAGLPPLEAAEGHRTPPHILDQTLAIECDRKLKLESKN